MRVVKFGVTVKRALYHILKVFFLLNIFVFINFVMSMKWEMKGIRGKKSRKYVKGVRIYRSYLLVGRVEKTCMCVPGFILLILFILLPYEDFCFHFRK